MLQKLSTDDVILNCYNYVLLNRNACPLVLRFLYNLYKNSKMQVRWCDELSNIFNVKFGVKQGRVLSATLFTVYIDKLFTILNRSRYGCHIE